MADYESRMKSDLRFHTHYATKGSSRWQAFDEYRTRDSETTAKLKAYASELLGLYALMRHFVELRFKDRPHELVAQRSSFFACCHVVDAILQLKTGLVDPSSAAGCAELNQAIFTHLRLHITAYGTERIKPKHHLNHGLAKQFLENGVLDAFVAERPHLRVKEVAEQMEHLTYFEPSVFGRVMQRQIFALRDEGRLRSGLRGKIVECPSDGLLLASSLECATLKVSVDDVVCYNKLTGVVRACVCDNGRQLLVIAKQFQWRGTVTDHSDCWRLTSHLAVWPANALASSRSWYTQGEDVVLVW